MFRFFSALRLIVVGLAVLAAAPFAAAQPVAEAAPWQATITGQIEAFRNKDAPGAFQFAGAPFQRNFPSAEAFFVAIISSGYSPIMESRSHSFGAFQQGPDASVLQEVRLVGTDQSLYGAIYQLREEENGWRVMGVQLMKQPGMGI